MLQATDHPRTVLETAISVRRPPVGLAPTDALEAAVGTGVLTPEVVDDELVVGDIVGVVLAIHHQLADSVLHYEYSFESHRRQIGPHPLHADL